TCSAANTPSRWSARPSRSSESTSAQIVCGTFPARAATNLVCASRTGLVDFGRRPRDISWRIAVVMHSAWAMATSVAWVRAGGEFAACHRPASYLHFRCIYVKTKIVKMTSGNRPRGRPSKRPQDRLFQMRVSEQFLRTVDDWRRYQTDLPSRAEA